MAVSDRSAEVAPAPAAEGDKEPPAVAVAAPSRDQNPGPAAATEAQVNTIASPSVKNGAGTPRRLPMAGDTAAPKQAGAQLNSQVAATKIQVGEAGPDFTENSHSTGRRDRSVFRPRDRRRIAHAECKLEHARIRAAAHSARRLGRHRGHTGAGAGHLAHRFVLAAARISAATDTCPRGISVRSAPALVDADLTARPGPGRAEIAAARGKSLDIVARIDRNASCRADTEFGTPSGLTRNAAGASMRPGASLTVTRHRSFFRRTKTCS